MTNRLAVTGIGVVSALGLDGASYWAGLVDGRCALRPVAMNLGELCTTACVGKVPERRGAHIRGEIIGYGASSDAHHLTEPSSDGGARAIKRAIADAGVFPADIGYVNAHGTGTLANNASETAAIRQAFGSAADRLQVSSTKSMHGHAIGAAGALEAVATLLALEKGILPPTVNYDEPDPLCDLDVIPNTSRETQVEMALSNSFAFGGLNGVLAFRRWRPPSRSTA